MYCVTRSCSLYRLPPEGFDFGWYQLHLPWKTTYLNYGVLENKDRTYSLRSLATWECLGRSMGIWVFMVPREFCRAAGCRGRHSGQTAFMQKHLEVQASFPTVQGLLGAWRADLSNIPQRYWFLVQVSSLPVKTLATSHWCRMESQDRAAQNTEKRKLGPWWETAGDCEVWTINLEIQDNDRTVASLWLSQYSNLLVCLSSLRLSLCLYLSRSLSHT